MQRLMKSSIGIFLTLASSTLYAQEPVRVGAINALHDNWAESNSNAARGMEDLGYHAIKVWPTVPISSGGLVQEIYTNPNYDVIVLRPLENSVQEQGCTGLHYRWENIDYGAVATWFLQNHGSENKMLILTGWEADNQIRGIGCTGIPTQAEQISFRQMLDARQAGIDAAKAAYPNATLQVYHAVEVNAVGPGSDCVTGFAVVRCILPFLQKQPDFVAYSAWGSNLGSLQDNLDIIAGWTGLPNEKIFLGEFGRKDSDPNAPNWIVNFGSLAFDWGVPFAFYWQYRDDFPGAPPYRLVTGTYPNITATQSEGGLSNLRDIYDNWPDGFSVPLLPPPENHRALGSPPSNPPTLSWDPVTGAQKYRMWVYDFWTGQKEEFRTVNASNTQYTLASGADVQPVYRFRMKTRNQANVYGDYGGWAYFSFVDGLLDPPTGFSTSGPSSQPTLSWNAVDGARSFRIEFETNAGVDVHPYPRTINANGNPTHVLETTLSPGTYRWRVKTRNAAGSYGPDWSPWQTLTVP